jgi:hypothetical protein
MNPTVLPASLTGRIWFFLNCEPLLTRLHWLMELELLSPLSRCRADASRRCRRHELGRNYRPFSNPNSTDEGTSPARQAVHFSPKLSLLKSLGRPPDADGGADLRLDRPSFKVLLPQENLDHPNRSS